jgi:hypothetical protein
MDRTRRERCCLGLWGAPMYRGATGATRLEIAVTAYMSEIDTYAPPAWADLHWPGATFLWFSWSLHVRGMEKRDPHE